MKIKEIEKQIIENGSNKRRNNSENKLRNNKEILKEMIKNIDENKLEENKKRDEEDRIKEEIVKGGHGKKISFVFLFIFWILFTYFYIVLNIKKRNK